MTTRNDRPIGRGIYIWQIRWMKKTFGDNQAVARHILDHGFDWVIWKVLGGRWDYQDIDDMISVSDILRRAGVQIWGYQYEYPGGVKYGYMGTVKAQVAAGIAIVGRMGLDGFVIDAESQMKHRPNEARAYASGLRAGLPNTPIALSTYRYPEVHPEFPWESYLPFIDLNMPQVYWQGTHNPAAQLRKTKDQYDRLAPGMDLIPIGSAYAEHGWVATPDDLQEFNNMVLSLGYAAEGYWEYMGAWNNGLLRRLSQLPDFPSDLPTPTDPLPDNTPEDWEEFKAFVVSSIDRVERALNAGGLQIEANVDDLDTIKSWIRSFDNGQ